MDRILLADDHLLYRECFNIVLRDCFPNAVISQVGNWAEVHKLSKRGQFDLALVDLKMFGEKSWFEELQALIDSSRSMRVCAVSSLVSHASLKQAYEAGAKGYIAKNQPKDEVQQALFQIANGYPYFPNNIWASEKETPPRSKSTLSQRQCEVLALIAQGYSNKKIASTLALTESTVKRHIYNIFNTLSVKNRSEAVRTAQLRGILS